MWEQTFSASKWLVFVVAMTISTSTAADDAIQPGTYTRDGGWGTLILKRNVDGEMQFDIHSQGRNHNFCTINGPIHDGIATLVPGSHKPNCLIRFSRAKIGVNVEAVSWQDCFGWCGLQATFEGEFLPTEPACLTEARQARIARATTFFSQHEYRAAADELILLLYECRKAIPWIEDGEVRNTLALSLLRLGQRTDCLTILGPASVVAGTGLQDLSERLAPDDLEDYVPIARETWRLRKLCKGKIEE